MFELNHRYLQRHKKKLNLIVIFLDFHSTKQGPPLVGSRSRGLD